MFWCIAQNLNDLVSAFGVSDSAEGLKMLLLNGMCYSRLLSKIYVNYWRILKSRSTRETSLRESIEILRNSRHDSRSFFEKLSRTSRELLQNTFISFVYRSLTAFSFEMVKVCLRNTAVPSHIWILLACQVETTQVSGFCVLHPSGKSISWTNTYSCELACHLVVIFNPFEFAKARNLLLIYLWNSRRKKYAKCVGA